MQESKKELCSKNPMRGFLNQQELIHYNRVIGHIRNGIVRNLKRNRMTRSGLAKVIRTNRSYTTDYLFRGNANMTVSALVKCAEAFGRVLSIRFLDPKNYLHRRIIKTQDQSYQDISDFI